VTFDLDANGILHVSAKDLGTGKENKVRIEQSSGLSQSEIDKMKRDAESHADEDKKKREFADARVEAENRAFQVEKLLQEHGEKIGAADKAAIERAVEKVKEATKGTDLSALKTASDELTQAAQAMSQHLYSQQAQPPGAPGATPSEEPKKGGDDVIDAEYEVKK
jgi:molecular chaperone DnaK